MLREFKSAAAAVALAVGVAAHGSVADAAFIFDSSLYGDFALPNSVALFSFSVAANNTPVTIQTSTDQTPIKGFDTNLALFNGSGTLLSNGLFTDTPGIQNILNISGTDYNGRITGNLDLGTYYVTLTQFDNIADGPSLSNPNFRRQSQPYYTQDLIENDGFGCEFAFTTGDCLPPPNSIQRTGAWHLEITGAESAAFVPLPGALPLLATALAGLGVASWRQRRQRPGAPTNPS